MKNLDFKNMKFSDPRVRAVRYGVYTIIFLYLYYKIKYFVIKKHSCFYTYKSLPISLYSMTAILCYTNFFKWTSFPRKIHINLKKKNFKNIIMCISLLEWFLVNGMRRKKCFRYIIITVMRSEIFNLTCSSSSLIRTKNTWFIHESGSALLMTQFVFKRNRLKYKAMWEIFLHLLQCYVVKCPVFKN
jgi:hypothetical protein